MQRFTRPVCSRSVRSSPSPALGNGLSARHTSQNPVMRQNWFTLDDFAKGLRRSPVALAAAPRKLLLSMTEFPRICAPSKIRSVPFPAIAGRNGSPCISQHHLDQADRPLSTVHCSGTTQMSDSGEFFGVCAMQVYHKPPESCDLKISLPTSLTELQQSLRSLSEF